MKTKRDALRQRVVDTVVNFINAEAGTVTLEDLQELFADSFGEDSVWTALLQLPIVKACSPGGSAHKSSD